MSSETRTRYVARGRSARGRRASPPSPAGRTAATGRLPPPPGSQGACPLQAEPSLSTALRKPEKPALAFVGETDGHHPPPPPRALLPKPNACLVSQWPRLAGAHRSTGGLLSTTPQSSLRTAPGTPGSEHGSAVPSPGRPTGSLLALAGQAQGVPTSRSRGPARWPGASSVSLRNAARRGRSRWAGRCILDSQASGVLGSGPGAAPCRPTRASSPDLRVILSPHGAQASLDHVFSSGHHAGHQGLGKGRMLVLGRLRTP